MATRGIRDEITEAETRSLCGPLRSVATPADHGSADHEPTDPS